MGCAAALVVHRLKNQGAEDSLPAGDSSSSSNSSIGNAKDLQFAAQGALLVAGSLLLAILPNEGVTASIGVPALMVGAAAGAWCRGLYA